MENTKPIIKNPLIQMFIKSIINKYHIHVYNKRYTINQLYYDIIATYNINGIEYHILNILNDLIGYKHIYNIMGNKSDIKKMTLKK